MVKFRSSVDYEYEETVKVLNKVQKPTKIHAEDYVIVPDDNDERQDDILELDTDDFREDA